MIIKAYHPLRRFKSDADSEMRVFVKFVVWSAFSQVVFLLGVFR